MDNKLPVTKEALDLYIAALYPQYPKEILCFTGRTMQLVSARHFAMYLHYHYDCSLPSYQEVGRRFHRDHATVIHACKKIWDINSVDAEEKTKFNNRVKGLETFILNRQMTNEEFNYKQNQRRTIPNSSRKFFPIFK